MHWLRNQQKPSDGMSAADDATVGRLLCSFVPALMLKAIDKNKAITPPTSHQYEAVALFAVRPRPPPRTATQRRAAPGAARGAN